MTGKEYLLSYLRAKEDVYRARMELLEMYSLLDACGSGIKQAVPKCKEKRDVIGDKLGSIEDKINDYLDLIIERTQKQEEVKAIIEKVPGANERRVLEKMYLESDISGKAKTLIEIAEEMTYSLRQVQRYYKAGVDYLEKIMS